MLGALLAVVVTLVAGPFMFYVLGRNARRGLQRWPVGSIDGWGDLVFLPLFNAMAVFFGVFDTFSLGGLCIGLLFGLFISVGFTYWRRDVAAHDDWSRPRKGVFALGGWYHSFFMFVQGSFIAYSLVLLGWSWWLWLPLIGYMFMVVVRGVTLLKKS